MKAIFSVLALLMSFAVSAFASDGMVDVMSEFSVMETVARFEGVLKQKGMKIFDRVDHAAGASGVGIKLRDTTLIIFGSPQVGSPLMGCEQRVAIDLPQKALIWKDEDDQVWVSYNDPGYLKKRHDIEGCDAVLGKVTKALAGMTKTAATK